MCNLQSNLKLNEREREKDGGRSDWWRVGGGGAGEGRNAAHRRMRG